MSHKEHFRVAGRDFALDKETVEQKLATIKPKPISLLYVRVKGKNYPVKQALSEATGIIRARFTSQDASRVLGKVGFEAKEKRTK